MIFTITISVAKTYQFATLTLKLQKQRQNGRYDNSVTMLLRHDLFYDTLRLFHLHSSTKFEANWSEKVATVAKLNFRPVMTS